MNTSKNKYDDFYEDYFDVLIYKINHRKKKFRLHIILLLKMLF